MNSSGPLRQDATHRSGSTRPEMPVIAQVPGRFVGGDPIDNPSRCRSRPGSAGQPPMGTGTSFAVGRSPIVSDTREYAEMEQPWRIGEDGDVYEMHPVLPQIRAGRLGGGRRVAQTSCCRTTTRSSSAKAGPEVRRRAADRDPVLPEPPRLPHCLRIMVPGVPAPAVPTGVLPAALSPSVGDFCAGVAAGTITGTP